MQNWYFASPSPQGSFSLNKTEIKFYFFGFFFFKEFIKIIILYQCNIHPIYKRTRYFKYRSLEWDCGHSSAPAVGQPFSTTTSQAPGFGETKISSTQDKEQQDQRRPSKTQMTRGKFTIKTWPRFNFSSSLLRIHVKAQLHSPGKVHAQEKAETHPLSQPPATRSSTIRNHGKAIPTLPLLLFIS